VASTQYQPGSSIQKGPLRWRAPPVERLGSGQRWESGGGGMAVTGSDGMDWGGRRAWLPPRPLRGALLQEGGEPLQRVLTPEDPVELNQLLGQVPGGGVKLGRLHYPVDQSQLQGSGRVDLIAGEKELRCPTPPQQPWQPLGASPSRDDPQQDLGLAHLPSWSGSLHRSARCRWPRDPRRGRIVPAAYRQSSGLQRDLCPDRAPLHNDPVVFRRGRARRAVNKQVANSSAAGQLPSFLGETTAPLNQAVSPDERMPTEDLPGYLATGRSALKAVQLAQLAARHPGFESILDMACGHGRVLRWLQAAYPEARLTACDLLHDGVDFCASTFGAKPVYAIATPTAEMFPDRYDLIWVGSLLTHLDADKWVTFIRLWHDLLAPDGLLVATTHGQLVAERMRDGNHYGYPPPSITRILRSFDHAGFAFLEASTEEIDYGISVSKPEWVIARLLTYPDFRLVLFTEALWANHQDVVAVAKRTLDSRIAERPD